MDENSINYLLEYFKTDNYFMIDDKIVIDDIHYSLSLEYKCRQFSAILTPSFQYDCGEYQNIKLIKHFDLMYVLDKLKDKMENIHIFLYALDTTETTILVESSKDNYKTRLELLKYLNQHNICYVCREPTLNTEHTNGCIHTIHFKCLYQISINVKSELYTCGICKQQIPWYHIFKKK